MPINSLLRKGPLCLVLLFGMAIACGRETPSSDRVPEQGHRISPEFIIEDLQEYGWFDLGDSTSTLGERERRFSGGVLGIVTAMSEAPDGSLFVLDRQYHKIVRFSASGEFQGVFAGGFGEGPGEFTRPRGLTLGLQSEVLVTDQALGRLSVLGPDGAFRRSVKLQHPQVLDLVQAPNGLFLRAWAYTKRSPQVLRIDPQTGVVIEELLLASDRDAHFGSFGESGALGVDPTGDVLYAHPSPGIWTVLTGPHAGVGGLELFPDAQGRVLPRPNGGEARASPVGARGIARWEDSTVVILYFLREGTADRTEELSEHSFFLAVFSPTGEYEGSVALGEGFIGGFEASGAQGEFYVAYYEPYPRVVRHRLRRREEGDQR